VLAQLVIERAGEPDLAELRCAVRAEAGVSVAPRLGRHGDDRAVADHAAVFGERTRVEGCVEQPRGQDPANAW